MKVFRPNNKQTGFTLVEIMIVVLIIGILLAIAIPNFVSARESSRAKACIGNLKQIDSATQQYAMDKKLNGSASGTQSYASNPPTLNTVATTGIVGATGYIRQAPSCPSGGTYSVAAAITGDPLCSISTVNTDANYQGPDSTTSVTPAGKFYHGLGQ